MSSRVARTSSTGRPLGSSRSQSRYVFPGMWERVAAAHGHDDVGSLGELKGERLRLAVREVHVELAHHLDDFGVDMAVGIRLPAGGQRQVAALGGALDERLAHLR